MAKDPIKTLEWLIKDAEIKAARLIDQTITEMVQVLQTEHLTGGTSPTSLAHRTGKLARGIAPIKAMVKGAKVIGAIRSSEKYTKVHFGPRGTTFKIVPKHSKFLAIPTEHAKTAAGVARGRPRDNIWGPTFIRGGVIYGYSGGTRASEGTRPIPLFVLKSSVLVPRRVDPKKDLIARFRNQFFERLKQITKV